MIAVCRHCRGPIEYTLQWIHSVSGDQWCPLSFGLATASPIMRVGTPTPLRKDTP